MSLIELFPAIKLLPRADKLSLLRLLVVELRMRKAYPCSQRVSRIHPRLHCMLSSPGY